MPEFRYHVTGGPYTVAPLPQWKALKVAGRFSHLCTPDDSKSCFACCPPLQMPNDDPLDRQDSLGVLFRKNRERHLKATPSFQPIDGWSCWGLGYLDDEKRKIGCLLHPMHHEGQDYRFLIDYGDKCSRELCLQAETFNHLMEEEKAFCLRLAEGMNSFEYSSRKANPLFSLLLWREPLVKAMCDEEKGTRLEREAFVEKYRVFLTVLSFRRDSFLVHRVVKRKGLKPFFSDAFLGEYEEFRDRLFIRYRNENEERRLPEGRGGPCLPYVHEFPISVACSRMLKFGLNVWRSDPEELGRLSRKIKREIDTFIERLEFE